MSFTALREEGHGPAYALLNDSSRRFRLKSGQLLAELLFAHPCHLNYAAHADLILSEDADEDGAALGDFAELRVADWHCHLLLPVFFFGWTI